MKLQSQFNKFSEICKAAFTLKFLKKIKNKKGKK